MTHRHTLLVVSVAVAMLVSPTILAQETATATANTTNESETAGMGAQLTAFTQSNSAAVNDSVENGMWKAGFNESNESDRARLVQNRTGTLERRLERLQRQNATLQERYENGSLPEPAYIAQQSRLSARIDGLRTAVNDTDTAATRAGVNDSRLEQLRRNASDLRGPEVAAVARGLGGGPPDDRGPPADRGERGPPGNRTGGGDAPGAENGGQAGPSNSGNASDSSRGGNGGSDAGSGGGSDVGSGGGSDAGSGGGSDVGSGGDSDAGSGGGSDAGSGGGSDAGSGGSRGGSGAGNGGGSDGGGGAPGRPGN